MTPSLEGWPTKAKEAPSPHEVRISLLDTNPVFQSLRGSKILEKLMYKRLYTFLEKNNGFFPYRFGFRTNHSRNSALIEITEQI